MGYPPGYFGRYTVVTPATSSEDALMTTAIKLCLLAGSATSLPAFGHFYSERGCCDSATGACGSCPCEGVLCPEGQVCEADECVLDTTGEGGNGAGGSGSQGGNGGEGAASQQGGSSASGGPPDERIWGLATGGGGCACSLSEPRDNSRQAGLAGLLLALALMRPRKRAPGAKKEAQR